MTAAAATTATDVHVVGWPRHAEMFCYWLHLFELCFRELGG
jgi:hypothetical protein